MLRYISRSAFVAATAFGVVAAPAFVVSQAQAETQPAKPVGHVKFETKSADIGIGGTWGKGTLSFGGKTYHFKVSGGDIAAVGFSTMKASGDVYNLKHVYDFDGTYGTLNGEATIAEGRSGTILQNSNGVRLRVTSDTEGGRLAAGIQGLHFKITK